ncbi:hypothetical protein Tco_1279338, partial [Tanacetum coccineum]
MPTYRNMMIREGLNKEEIRLNLDLLIERRELASIREATYKTKLEKGQFSKEVDTRKHRLLPDGSLPSEGPYGKISKGLAKRVQPECMAPKGAPDPPRALEMVGVDVPMEGMRLGWTFNREITVVILVRDRCPHGK